MSARWKYAGDFAGTPYLLAIADPNRRAPPPSCLPTLGAAITKQTPPGKGLTVTPQELAPVNKFIFH
ncbi:hypothetical protein [Hymenobacter bucti]|uniref:Uncharacterized protein n=1 Tax=Hymenobacter bucti TaxID=1844114 RepID=A0ABW4QTW8_9BACT